MEVISHTPSIHTVYDNGKAVASWFPNVGRLSLLCELSEADTHRAVMLIGQDKVKEVKQPLMGLDEFTKRFGERTE